MAMLTLAEELMLLALDDETGKGSARSGLDQGLAGAVLCELVLAGRIAIIDDRVVLRADGIIGEPVEDAVLAQVAAREKPRKPADWVGRLAGGVRRDVLARLQERGLIRAERHRVLGLLPSTRYPEADGSAEREVRERLDAVLAGGARPDERTAALIAIAQAARVGAALAGDRPWKEVEPRAKEIAEGDWAAAAVRKAIQSVNAAVLAATVAASSASVAGS
ncbi:MAG: hypothetical protein QOD69_3425 [Solirubrobacteraceae bacterium]|jgi:hypothetical protein|nr:hypothetical protein [Solirubrobacteraceae bacterium]